MELPLVLDGRNTKDPTFLPAAARMRSVIGPYRALGPRIVSRTQLSNPSRSLGTFPGLRPSVYRYFAVPAVHEAVLKRAAELGRVSLPFRLPFLLKSACHLGLAISQDAGTFVGCFAPIDGDPDGIPNRNLRFPFRSPEPLRTLDDQGPQSFELGNQRAPFTRELIKGVWLF